MAAGTDKLMERALEAQRRLEAQGLRDEARVVHELLELVVDTQARQPRSERQFYTTAEAGRIIGVTPQTIKNWVARGLLAGYRLGGRIVIPRAALEEYRALGAAMQDIEPLPPVEDIVRDVRAGRRAIRWPESSGEAPDQQGPEE